MKISERFLYIWNNLRNNWWFWAAVWAAVNVIQAITLPLIDDEAYYWIYSEHLAWGYFDHPPMIGLFIKLGYWLFPSEFGVRLLTIISLLITLRIVWLLIEMPTHLSIKKEENTMLFWGIAFVMPILHIYGLFSTPDVPLLLFSSMTLWAYKRFSDRLDEPFDAVQFANILFFALAAAGLMYSKYQGALLLIFMMIADWRLLRNWKFYLVGGLAIVLFLPHLYWQISHELPSFQYHLVGRVVRKKWWYIPEYFLNQLLIHSPLMFLVFIPVLGRVFKKFVRQQGANFSKTLWWITIGFWGFFFLVSLQRRHIEPHWTAIAALPVLILTFETILNNPKLLRRSRTLMLISLVLIIIARLNLNFPLWQYKHQPIQQKIEQVERVAGDRYVFYLNSYQKASQHAFYAKKKYGNSFNSADGWRDNQFSLIDLAEEAAGKPVMFASFSSFDGSDTTTINGNTLYYKHIERFIHIKDLSIKAESHYSTFSVGDTAAFVVEINNPYEDDFSLEDFSLQLLLCEGRSAKHIIPTTAIRDIQNKRFTPIIIEKKSNHALEVQLVIPDQVGTWNTNWTLQYKDHPFLHHASFSKLIIAE